MTVRNKKYIIECPSCKENREVTYCQSWNISKGICTGKCKKCSPRNMAGLVKGGWNKGLVGFLKGRKIPNNGKSFLGKIHSEESKEKMRLAKTGKIGPCLGKKWKIKDKSNLNPPKGEKHWNWKNGKTTENKKMRMKFRTDIFYKILERDNFSCAYCKKRGGYLQVYHIKKWSDFPELRFVEENCITLCMECHYKKTFGREIKKGLVWGHNFKHITF